MLQAVDALGPDMLGMIFYDESPRCYAEETAPETQADKVGVFVNESAQVIKVLAQQFGLSYIQLHGDEPIETAAVIKAAGLKVIKAFSIGEKIEEERMKGYEQYCEYFLLDTKGKRYGGTGQKFDWALLSEYRLDTPFILSGGIQPKDANILTNIKHPALIGVDINSGFEIEPGIKNIEAVKQFIHAVSE